MSTVETKGHVSPPRVKILIQYNSNLLQTFSTYSSKGDFIRNCFNFDPTFFSFSNFGKKILKLCIFSALGSSFVVLSFWPAPTRRGRLFVFGNSCRFKAIWLRVSMFIRVSQKTLFLNFASSVESLVRMGVQRPQIFFQRYRPINDT